jgi:mannose/cellobiose epimerase-like protein (N-acyl-D-glucosamine 2-epimerase family)
MKKIDFTVSDLIAGYVIRYDSTRDAFGLKTSDGREFLVNLTPTAHDYVEIVHNLGENYQNAADKLKEMLVPGRYLFVYGIFYPDGPSDEHGFEAKHIVFLGTGVEEYRFEEQDWWISQIRQLAEFYLKAEFDDGEIDYRKYRTNLSLTGQREGERQEADTISRLVYGFASAYLMTGEDRYLEAAQKGTDYLREKMQKRDKNKDVCLWYHAVDIKEDGTEQKIFASEFGEDKGAVPCYEQIYALAGPMQTYRVTGDPRILSDIKATVNAFNQFFRDRTEKGGFFSHIDPQTLSPNSASLGHNRAKKNWNSVGDHAPAYLINLWLATGEKEYADFLEDTFDTIVRHFPDFDNSPFVQEKFYEDWSHDTTYAWQQNRAVVGHNLKIAWNLMRMYSLIPKQSYTDTAKKIAALMPPVGYDQQRSGWYDVVERLLEPGQTFHRFVWHDRKAWWQQEQAILAYLILYGKLRIPGHLKLARESSAFYNAWFLDTQSGAVYFNVLANGLPYLLGTERGKGSHSMAGYHSFELAYLAAVYTNLLIKKMPMDFYFKPVKGGFKDNILRVAPDILPPGSVHIGEVRINGQKHVDFDSSGLTVKLPADQEDMKIKVRLVPT